MIAIIDYGLGNIRSVEKGFLKVGADIKVTDRAAVVEQADAVVLPGVSAFRDCMQELKNLDLIDVVSGAIRKGKPFLGICLGLQILFSESEEFGICRGLDIFKGKVVRFDFSAGPERSSLKVPHMGWNEIKIAKDNNPLYAGIPDKSYFYFVHSYYVAPQDRSVIATTTDYGIGFTSSIWKDNVYAVQFHPEKSQTAGLKMLENFTKIAAAK